LNQSIQSAGVAEPEEIASDGSVLAGDGAAISRQQPSWVDGGIMTEALG